MEDVMQEPVSNEDRTGLCTVRDAVELMFENKSDVLEMFFQHKGRKRNVELRILLVEDH